MVFEDQLTLKAFTCFWRIENFVSCRPNLNLLLKSQTFQAVDLFNSKWHLEIHQKDLSSFGIYIFLDGRLKSISVSFSIFLLTKKGWIPIVTKHEHDFVKNSGFGAHRICQWEYFEKERKNYLPHNCLTLSVILARPRLKSTQCFMNSKVINNNDLYHFPVQHYQLIKPSDFVDFFNPTPYQSATREVNDKTIQVDTSETNQFEGFQNLMHSFEEKAFQFVTLQTIDTKFVVYKALLCSESPVFNAMFERGMKEKTTHLVVIDDINSSTISLLVQFLNREPLDDLIWEEALKLYYAADKYHIERLKDKCVDLLQKKLSDENVCEAFLLSDLHQDERLRCSAQEYFCKNSKAILLSLEWKDFLLGHTEIASDVLRKMAEVM